VHALKGASACRTWQRPVSPSLKTALARDSGRWIQLQHWQGPQKANRLKPCQGTAAGSGLGRHEGCSHVEAQQTSTGSRDRCESVWEQGNSLASSHHLDFRPCTVPHKPHRAAAAGSAHGDGGHNVGSPSPQSPAAVAGSVRCLSDWTKCLLRVPPYSQQAADEVVGHSGATALWVSRRVCVA